MSVCRRTDWAWLVRCLSADGQTGPGWLDVCLQTDRLGLVGWVSVCRRTDWAWLVGCLSADGQTRVPVFIVNVFQGHTSDFKIGTSMATLFLPCKMPDVVGAGTGRPGFRYVVTVRDLQLVSQCTIIFN